MLDITVLTDQDIDELSALHVRVWQAAYAGIVPAETLDNLDPAVFAANRRTRPALPGAITFLTRDQGVLVGFASTGPHRDIEAAGELYALYVDPARWGTGAGRRLFAEVTEHQRALGHDEMLLWVFEANDRARRFYERMGMRPDGTKDYYTPRGSDARLPEVRYRMRL